MWPQCGPCEVTLIGALICISLIISSIGQIGAVINPIIPPKKLRRGDQVGTCPAGGCPGVGTWAWCSGFITRTSSSHHLSSGDEIEFLNVHESTCNARDPGDMHLIPRSGISPGSGRSPRGGHGNPLQYFCLENPMDIGAWQATVHGVAMSQTRLKQLSMSLSCKTQVWQTRLEPHVFKQLAMIGKSARVRATVLAHTLCLTGTRETQLSYPMSPRRLEAKLYKEKTWLDRFSTFVRHKKLGISFELDDGWLKARQSLEINSEDYSCNLCSPGTSWLWHCISVQLQECFHIPQFPARVPTDAALLATKKCLEACCPHSLVRDLLPL